VSDKAAMAQIKVVDMLGKVIYANDSFEAAEGANSFSSDFSNSAKGIHFIIVDINGERKTARFVVE
jgi:hypothetical protein